MESISMSLSLQSYIRTLPPCRTMFIIHVMLLFINILKGVIYYISTYNGWTVLQHCELHRHENTVALLHLQVQYISSYYAGTV